MKLTVDKMFLVLGILSFPNLFFRGQYNVPLMIFFFACWEDSYKGFITYSLIFSWCTDAYLLFEYISKSSEQKLYESGEKGQVVLVVSIVVFVSKTLLIIYMIIFEERCKQALQPSYLGKNFKKAFDFSKFKKVKTDSDKS